MVASGVVTVVVVANAIAVGLGQSRLASGGVVLIRPIAGGGEVGRLAVGQAGVTVGKRRRVGADPDASASKIALAYCPGTVIAVAGRSSVLGACTGSTVEVVA